MGLLEFLIKAKKTAYAKEKPDNLEILPNGSRELTFEEGDFVYKDRYYGFDPFSGEETVWQNGIPVWSMNYYGKITSKDVSPKEVYPFLRKAMRLIDESSPFRGPVRFEEGDFVYENNFNGDLNFFSGHESISYRGEGVYFLYYHGGFVRGKG